MTDLFERAAATGNPPKVAVSPAKAAPDPPQHVCAVAGCRGVAMFGFGVSLLKGRSGLWSCLEHRDDVKAMRCES
ncbi:hypothetical protein MHY1_01066 [Methylovirgula sp. HY1]|nr:hypothetical protein MHY1_01066 [Methylovirgula sp. HY1]